MQTRDCYHHLETNGTIIPEKPYLFNAIAVSPKGDIDRQWLTTKNATIKLVVDTIEEADRFQEKYNFPVNRFYVMARTIPGENQVEKEKKLVDECVARGYNFTTRLQVLYKWGRSQ
jgi:organic radical activating enzyme